MKFSVEPDGKRHIEVHRPLAQVEGENPQITPITHSADFASFVSQAEVIKRLLIKPCRAGRDPGRRIGG